MKHGDYIPIEPRFQNQEDTHYVRGHVTEQEASAALNSEDAHLGEGPMTLRHCYGRFVFPRDRSFSDSDLMVQDTPSRGAFKMTEVKCP